MTYSFAPLANVNTINDHTGFFVFLVGMLVFFVVTFFNCRDDMESAGWMVASFLFLTGIAALISWNSGEVKVYANTEVTGEFVGFVAEGFNITEHQGKTTRHVDKHFSYVVYRVDGQNILFPAETGVTYPTVAALYRN